ncbi:MAG: YbaN family protein [Prevotellaceae bacterium]|nr:YbaN family protein [Prevotellaceae bacterium]
MKKSIFIILGIVCVALGAVGVVTPVLPTTPFLLLAVFLFSRSSPALNHYLLHNKILGKYLSNYFENKPVPLSQKIISIAFLWTGLCATFYFATLSNTVIVLLLLVGLCVSLHITLLGKYRKSKKP